MENIRNRIDVRLVNERKKALKLTSKTNFQSETIFNENLVAIHMKKKSFTFNKPIYCRISILELSKTLMYKYHHNIIKPKYGEKAKLLFTDTDSFCYEIETDDFYEDIREDLDERYETSNFPQDHPSGIQSNKNKKVPGKFMDEASGKIILGFAGLRAKLYSLLYEGKEEKKCKGIVKNVVDKKLKHEDYVNCVKTSRKKMEKMNILKSCHHTIFGVTINKIALDANDDKRFILPDGIHTLAWV